MYHASKLSIWWKVCVEKVELALRWTMQVVRSCTWYSQNLKGRALGFLSYHVLVTTPERVKLRIFVRCFEDLYEIKSSSMHELELVPITPKVYCRFLGYLEPTNLWQTTTWGIQRPLSYLTQNQNLLDIFGSRGSAVSLLQQQVLLFSTHAVHNYGQVALGLYELLALMDRIFEIVLSQD